MSYAIELGKLPDRSYPARTIRIDEFQCFSSSGNLMSILRLVEGATVQVWNITRDEFEATGWRRDLAKPTTPEDCALARWHFTGKTDCTFDAWLARSREAWISQANSGRVGEPYKHAAAGSTPAPDTKPLDFLTWLASENKRAAVGELPPLQRAHVDAMLARRQERERVAAEANHFHVNEICAALKRRLEKKT